MNPFCLPDLGEGLKEAELVAWHVAEGDHVVADQPLVSVETEKAVVEIPSPQSGRIEKLLAKPGEHVQVGAPLLAFEEGIHPDTGTVVGSLAAPPDVPRPMPASRNQAGRPAVVQAAPAVRARARQLGVDLSTVTASGPGGTITIRDVEAAVPTEAATAEAPGDALRGARRAMALNMARAGREVVPATLHDEADVEAWSSADVTVRLIRALIAGCDLRATPQCQLPLQHLVAAAQSAGRSRACDRRPGRSFRAGAARCRPLRRGRLAAADRRVQASRRRTQPGPGGLRDPTITLSNFGTIAGQHAALVIVPPQVAIVGAGRIIDRPVRTDAGLGLHRMLRLSLTFDHRAVTGGDAARFLRAAIADLEKPD